MKALTVVQAFGDYQRGAQITDAKVITQVLESEQHSKVVPIELPDSEAENPPSAAE